MKYDDNGIYDDEALGTAGVSCIRLAGIYLTLASRVESVW